MKIFKKIKTLLLLIKLIFYSILNKVKPNKESITLAQKRFLTCSSCPFYSKNAKGLGKLKRKLKGYCTKCNCIISIKIFTPKESDIKCPLDKWEN